MNFTSLAHSMTGRLVKYGVLLGVLALAQSTFCALYPPKMENGIVQVPFTGESGVQYILESSPDGVIWAPISTNSDYQLSRLFDAGPANDHAFFRVFRKPLPVFAAAITAINLVNLNGKELRTDSFDSADPIYSTNGLYPFGDPGKQNDNGHVITDLGLFDSFGLGMMKVKGIIRTGPTGSVAITSNTCVGSKSWVEGNTNGIQPGFVLNDMNAFFPSSTVPSGAVWSASGTGGTVDGIYYDRIYTSGDYKLSIVAPGAKFLISGDVRLWILGTVNMTGVGDTIRIATNASLKLYLGGNAKFGENYVVVESGNASAFYCFGLPNNTSLEFAGHTPFTGVIYAPSANLILKGASTNTYDFVGSCVAKSLTLIGNYYIHFDENFMRTGPTR